jgi:hypothetical protein
MEGEQMSYPSNPQYRLIAVIVATAAVMAFAVTAAGAADVMKTQGSAMPSTVTTSAIGIASSTTTDAYLATGDMALGKFEKVHGTVAVKARDLSDIRSVDSRDALDYGIARIHVPSSNSVYEVRFTGLDRAGDKSYFGGVGIMKSMFGSTGIGESFIPRTVAYLCVSGTANVLKDGVLLATNTPASIVVMPGIFDIATEKFVSEANIDYGARMIGLHVPGPIEGLPDNNLMVGWTQAAVDLHDVGGRILTEREVTTALLPGEIRRTGVVAGEAVEVIPHSIAVSLTDRGFMFPSRAGITPGLYTFNITNNSSINRGFLVRGKDIGGYDFARYTAVLRPGQTTTLSVYLPSGRFQVAEFHQDLVGGRMNWYSNYRTNLSVR